MTMLKSGLRREERKCADTHFLSSLLSPYENVIPNPEDSG
jgi:hypothetical protein